MITVTEHMDIKFIVLKNPIQIQVKHKSPVHDDHITQLYTCIFEGC